MRAVLRFACPNTGCKRYGEQRDGRGYCPGCGYRTRLAQIFTRRSA